MAEKEIGTLKIKVTADTKDAQKDIEKMKNNAVKANKEINNSFDVSAEKAKIKKQVEERDKIYRQYLKEELRKLGEEDQFDVYYSQYQKKSSESHAFIQSQFMHNGQWLETPWQLEEALNKELLKKQEVLKVEKEITQEKEKQSNYTLTELAETGKEVVKQGSDIGKDLSKGVEGLAPALKGIAGTLAEALPVILLIAGVVVLFAGILDLFMQAVEMAKEENKDLKAQLIFVKSMVESIVYTLVPLATKAIEFVLNLVIEALRFLQHVIYALSGGKLDILAYTMERFNKNLEKAKKNAGELRKQLMGFDEANVLNDSGTSGIGNFFRDLSIDEKYFDKINDRLTDIRKKWDDYVEHVKNKMKDKSYFNENYGIWGQYVNGLYEIWGGIIESWDGIIWSIAGLGTMLVGLLTNDWQLVRYGWNDFCEGIKRYWKGTIDFIKGIWDAFWGNLKATGTTIINWITKLYNAYSKYIKPVMQNLLPFFSNKNTTWNLKVNADTNNANSKLTKLAQLASTVWAVTTPGVPLTTKASSLWNGVKSLFGLDSGGIVLARPGYGVPIGNAIMSERRNEAVIPFENPEAMEKIGEAIGKWVNIAIQNDMIVDGRVLASATNNQMNKERFLMNR